MCLNVFNYRVLHYIRNCTSLSPSHRYQFVLELVDADLSLTMHGLISGFFFAIRFLLHDLDVLDK